MKSKKLVEYITIIILASFSALNYIIFIFPNSFAPSGIDGICTMVQHVFNVNMGYLSLIINLPLLVLSIIYLNKDYAIKSSIYIIVFSIVIIFLKNSAVTQFSYHTDTGTSIVLAPIVAGIIRGAIYALTIKLNGSSGGVDIIASLIKIRRPYYNLMNTILTLNIIVAISAYFVYGMKPEPVICSIIYSLITTIVTNQIQARANETVKFEIITSTPDELCSEIVSKLQQSATILGAQGAYSGEKISLVICVVKKQLVPQVEKIIKAKGDTIVFKSIINN